MKRYKILFIFLTLIASSCNLNLIPENSVTFTNYFENEKDLESVTFHTHALMKSAMEMPMQVYAGELFDEVTSSTDIGVRELIPSIVINNYMNKWVLYYNVIYNSNVILDNVHRVRDMKDERRNFHIGQAHFIKGFMYLQLSMRWGDAIITKNSITTTPYATSPIIDVINESIRCGEMAFEILPLYEDMQSVGGAPFSSKQYGTKGTVAVLLAQAYAWKGSIIDLYGLVGQNSKEAYEKSVYWSTQIIDKKVGKTYSLEGSAEEVCTKGLVGGAASKESIFELETDFTKTSMTCYSPIVLCVEYPIRLGRTEGSRNAGRGVFHSTVKRMYAPNDERRSSFFYNIEDMEALGDNITKGWAYPQKLREGVLVTRTGTTTLQWMTFKANYVYWRLADIHLLRAECNNKLGVTADAITDLNVIRNRAKATIYPANGENDLKLAIFKEREKELFHEGHRYFDIIRNNYIKEELLGNYKTLSPQDIRDGALFQVIGNDAFANNDIIRQNRYWSRFL